MTRRPADLSSDRMIMIVNPDDDVTAERSTAWLGRHEGGEPVALSYPSIPTHAVRRVPIAPPETVSDPFETKLQPSMSTETSTPGPDGYTNCSKSTRPCEAGQPYTAPVGITGQVGWSMYVTKAGSCEPVTTWDCTMVPAVTA